MSASGKHVVFDVVGTLVGYERLFNAIDHRLGDRLRAEGVKPSLLGELWIEAAEREYTYLSMSGHYTPFAVVVEGIFFRMLWKAGISQPRNFASAQDISYLMAAYSRLEMRPGARACIQKLRDAGFTVWGLTAGDLAGVAAFFKAAEIDLPPEHLLSCDSNGIGKPDPKAYLPLFNQLSDGAVRPWFAAAHMWDVSAAKRIGWVPELVGQSLQLELTPSSFKGAYCSVFEHEPLTELFGEVDVLADSLPEMADKINAASS